MRNAKRLANFNVCSRRGRRNKLIAVAITLCQLDNSLNTNEGDSRCSLLLEEERKTCAVCNLCKTYVLHNTRNCNDLTNRNNRKRCITTNRDLARWKDRRFWARKLQIEGTRYDNCHDADTEWYFVAQFWQREWNTRQKIASQSRKSLVKKNTPVRERCR